MYRQRVIGIISRGNELVPPSETPGPGQVRDANGPMCAAFAGDLGIYGQAVLLDHGQGLFSLYGHLGGLQAKVGERVEPGAVLGTSGRTGMAGGDHLHLSLLVSGTFVAPAEWLDAHWIADNVENKLALLGAAAPPAR